MLWHVYVLFLIAAQQFRHGQPNSSEKTDKDAPPVSTTVHILSLLLRLRQCCCHLSLLKVVRIWHLFGHAPFQKPGIQGQKFLSLASVVLIAGSGPGQLAQWRHLSLTGGAAQCTDFGWTGQGWCSVYGVPPWYSFQLGSFWNHQEKHEGIAFLARLSRDSCLPHFWNGLFPFLNWSTCSLTDKRYNLFLKM